MTNKRYKSEDIKKLASITSEAKGMINVLLPHLPPYMHTRLGTSGLMALMTPALSREKIDKMSRLSRRVLHALSPSIAAHDYMKRVQRAALEGKTIGALEKSIARDKKIKKVARIVANPRKRRIAMNMVSKRIKNDPILSAIGTGALAAAIGAAIAPRSED